jgi:exopolysaccharide biosynthesis polyprenyl glycosylphosphotransferase
VRDLELVDRRQGGRSVERAGDAGAAWGLAREPLLRRMLAAADVVAGLAVSATLAMSSGGVAAAAWSAFFVPAWVLLAKLFGLYDRDHQALRHVTADEVQSVFLWALTGTGVLTVFLHATPAGRISPVTAALVWLVAFGSALLVRGGARLMWRATTAPERTLILGRGPLADATRRKLELFPDIHVDVLGQRVEFTLPELEHLNGQLDGVDRVILAAPSLDEALLSRLVAVCRQRQTRLSVVPPARGMFGTAVHLTHVAELPVIEYNTWDPGRSTLILKRTMDVALASLGLVVLGPLLIAIGLVVRLSSPGPAIFGQVRSGLHGQPFRMLKFRTMEADAEERLSDLVAIDDLAEPVFKLRDDPRVTGLGRFLRRTSLDELPQLVNVLRGEMSLVGPRPEQVELVTRYTPGQRFRLKVKPGITGPMQVYGRGELTLDERLAVEREYIENLSLSRDIRILALTLGVVLSRRGAF